MIRRLLKEPDRADFIREVPVSIVAFDEANRSYRVDWRGAVVGPLWSVNGVRHSIGAQVKALAQGQVLVHIIP